MPRVVVVTGLAIGEETKGATVEWLAQILKAHTILRSGGSQAGHHIITDNGTEQMFSHFGCGTFNGSRTHLHHMVINPVDLFTEALELESKGVKNPFDLITIDHNCLTVTPFHGAMSRFREILRGSDKKGTIGKGVGEAVKDAQLDAKFAIRAGDFSLSKTKLQAKVEAIRQLKLQQSLDLIHKMGIEELPQAARDQLEILRNHKLTKLTVDSFKLIGELVQIVEDSYFEQLTRLPGTIVCEPSHGALLHPRFGFVPHVTQIDPTSSDVLQTLAESDYAGQVLRIGVSRCYMTRHGAGPLVSYDERLTAQIQETHNSAGSDWLGEFRNGHYDLVAMRYALQVCGKFDGLMISYLDMLQKFASWQVCEGYRYTGEATDLQDYFEFQGDIITEIKLRADSGGDDYLQAQARLTQLLKDCQPVLTTLLPTADQTLEQVFLNYVETQLGLPVLAIARGPKASDREIRAGWEQLFN